MRAYYLTPQDALFSILYVWMTAMANYSGDDEEETYIPSVPRAGDAGIQTDVPTADVIWTYGLPSWLILLLLSTPEEMYLIWMDVY